MPIVSGSYIEVTGQCCDLSEKKTFSMVTILEQMRTVMGRDIATIIGSLSQTPKLCQMDKVGALIA